MGQEQATKTSLKLGQLAKDLDKKSKDLLDVLEEGGVSGLKVSSTLTPGQFDVLLEKLTRQHQVPDIGAYLDEEVLIQAPKKKTAPRKAEPAEEGKKAESAPQTAPSEPKSAQKAADEAQKASVGASPVQNRAAENGSAVQKSAAEKASPAENAPAATSHAPAATGPSRVPGTTPPAAAPRPARPVYNIPLKAMSPTGGQPPRPGQSRPASGTQRPGAPYGQGQRAPYPAGQGQRPMPGRSGTGASAPRPGVSGSSPDSKTPISVSDRNARLLAEFGFGPGSKNNTQKNNRPGASRGGASKGKPGSSNYDHDKDSGGSVPHEKYKAPTIVRGESKASSRGATHVIDTRSSSVDLDKFDKRYDEFVPGADDEDTRGGSPSKVKRGSGMEERSGSKMAGRNKQHQKKQKMVIPKQQLTLALPEEIVVSDLAARLKVTAGEVVKKLIGLGMMATINQTIDYDTAALVADEFGAIVSKEVVVTIEDRLFDSSEDSSEELVERAPVVCVMGHVDHGKTSLLDAIRNTNVTAGEAGGITQHIGAYRVNVQGKEITFLDTPGHEAFTAMRARGAQATDIAILVVAADDGIMPQTVEAINHAKAAGVDIIVAINKMDKPGANPEAIKQELTKYDLVPEEWGGDVICVPVSALTHQGIDQLLESVLLVAEVKELKANPNRRAKGLVIEAKLDKGRGPVATILVQNGTLHSGDIVIAGTAVGRKVTEATPSVPVEITGLAEVPSAGDEFNAVEDERMARELADQRRDKAKEETFKANSRANLNDLFDQINEGVKELLIIVKADVGGSVEAVKQSLEKISTDEVKVRVIHGAAGGITEGDVMLAAASNAIIVGFNVRPDKAALDSAERQGVEIRTYRIIYECIDEITAAMKGMLAPKFRENLLGHAEVRQVIHVPNVGFIAGSYVQDGKITRGAQIRVIRDGVVIFEDKIASLRRFKDDAREVAAGYECGIGLDKFDDLKTGDILEAFVMEEIPQD